MTGTWPDPDQPNADPRDPQAEEAQPAVPPRLSADPDPDPDADVLPDRPSGLGEPAEDPDPEV
jgi:hypothetical protein